MKFEGYLDLRKFILEKKIKFDSGKTRDYIKLNKEDCKIQYLEEEFVPDYKQLVNKKIMLNQRCFKRNRF